MGQKLAEFFYYQPWPLFINYRTNVVASVIRTWIIWVEGKDADHHHGPDSSPSSFQMFFFFLGVRWLKKTTQETSQAITHKIVWNQRSYVA